MPPHHTAIQSLKRVFEFLIYSELTNGRTIRSHSISRLTSGRAIRLAITQLSSHQKKIFSVPDLA